MKWPGGKRWLANRILEILPQSYNTYIEPFLGGGALFFSLEPAKAILSDINSELINVYSVMCSNPSQLKEKMLRHNALHNKEYYYQIRGTQFPDNIDSAARFLYLNRTCYNGMYRVNRQHVFNVPIGTKNDCIYDVDYFNDYSIMLKKVELATCDFSLSIRRAGREDLIFADPPYASADKKSTGFVKYNDHLFGWEDQIRLHDELVAAKERGASIILTNANYQEIKEMYEKSEFYISEVSRISSIASNTEKRNKVKELLITSFPQ